MFNTETSAAPITTTWEIAGLLSVSKTEVVAELFGRKIGTVEQFRGEGQPKTCLPGAKQASLPDGGNFRGKVLLKRSDMRCTSGRRELAPNGAGTCLVHSRVKGASILDGAGECSRDSLRSRKLFWGTCHWVRDANPSVTDGSFEQ